MLVWETIQGAEVEGKKVYTKLSKSVTIYGRILKNEMHWEKNVNGMIQENTDISRDGRPKKVTMKILNH